MKVAIIGASGYVGSVLLEEASRRGHAVTALVTKPERVPQAEGVTAVRADVLNEIALAGQLKGHDVVISSFSGHAQHDIRGYYMQGTRSIVAAVKSAGIPRLLVVGGAGGLEIAPGLQLLDSDNFPSQWKATAEGARDALNMLRGEADLNWTVLAPPAHLEPGTRTGVFRQGRDSLLVDGEGHSHISLADYAVAMLDELEHPKHPRTRFTVGY